MEVKNCPECGKAGSSVKIGGTDHNLRSDNKQLQRFVVSIKILFM